MKPYGDSPTGMNCDSQVLRVRDDDDKFEITLNVQNFRPEELKVIF
jgi:hypothetical protein